MNFAVAGLLILAGLLVCLEVGYLLGARRVKASPAAHEGFGAIEAAVFGIFGLLLSLSFFGAGSRLDARRSLIVDETNAIAAAYKLVDILPDAEQPEVRRLFREYLDARLRFSREPEEAVAASEVRNSTRLQLAIWSHAVSATKAGAPGAPLLLAAINQMSDIAGKKTLAKQTHVPGLVFGLLIVSALLSALVAGFGMARGERNWLSMVGYALIVTMTLYVMMDMEYPRSGFIRLDAADRTMVDLRDSIQ